MIYHKISISLTNEAAMLVNAKAQAEGISVSEVIRRALAIQRFIDGQVAAGNDILTRTRGGDISRIELVFS